MAHTAGNGIVIQAARLACDRIRIQHGDMIRIALSAAFLCCMAQCGGAVAADSANDALAKACGQRDIESARKALEAGADPNTLDLEKDEPVLQQVLWDGSPELVELLLKAGAKADKEDEYGRTALHAAAGAYASGDTAVLVKNLRAILATGVDIHHKSHGGGGGDALAAAAGNHPDLVKILLEAGAKVSPEAVEQAVADYQLECLELLLGAGGDLNARLSGGRTLMHAACSPVWRRADPERKSAMFEKLLAAGLKVDVPDGIGLTPLLLAASHRNHAAVKWLLAHGADVNTMDNAGRTALLAAAESGEEESDCFAPLIDAGCPLAAVGKAKVTVLDTALHRRWWNTVNLLMRRGAVPRDAAKTVQNVLLAWREAPASPAATRGIVTRLLRRLPNAKGLGIDGRPLLHDLLFLNEESLVTAALKAGADIDERDSRGRTTLMWAAIIESEKMISLLRSAGADDSLRDSDGKTAAELAGVFRPPPPQAPPPSALPPPSDLFDAIVAGDAAAAERFMAADQNAVEAERLGLRPVHLAALNGKKEILVLLARHGADMRIKSAEGQAPFTLAALAGQADACRWFLAQAPAGDRTAMIEEAARLCHEIWHLSLAGVLLEYGWKPRPAQFAKVIVGAIIRNDAALVRVLISHSGGTLRIHGGGDPIAGDETRDLLDCAAQHAGPEVMGLLLAATIAKDPESWRGTANKALSTAVNRGNLPVARELLKTGMVDLNAPNEFQKPLLNIAAAGGHRDVVELLLESGHKLVTGTGILQEAVGTGDLEIIKLLLEAGAAPDDPDKDGNTALHVAARFGYHDVARLLLKGGASANSKTKSGLDTAGIADEEGYLDFADFLRTRSGAN
jgi:ankyrin repeat protein